jgi:hypothetical protein
MQIAVCERCEMQAWHCRRRRRVLAGDTFNIAGVCGGVVRQVVQREVVVAWKQLAMRSIPLRFWPEANSGISMDTYVPFQGTLGRKLSCESHGNHGWTSDSYGLVVLGVERKQAWAPGRIR